MYKWGSTTWHGRYDDLINKNFEHAWYGHYDEMVLSQSTSWYLLDMAAIIRFVKVHQVQDIWEVLDKVTITHIES